MMRYRVRHATRYGYAAAVDLAHHRLQLRPREFAHQRVLAAEIVAEPLPAAVAEHRDHFGNTVTVLAIDRPHDVFTVTMTAEVEVGFPPPPAATPPWEAVRGALQAALAGAPSPGERVGVDLAATIAAAELALPSEGADATVEDDAALLALAAPCFAPGTPILDGARALARAIHDGFAFDPAATTVSTPVGTVLKLRRGVCQDFAHVMIASLRRLGLAARYVSGYIRTHRSAGPDLRGVDASHAWVSVWCGGSGEAAGWIDLDPTNDLVVADEHVTVAWGRDYGDISPIRGVVLGGGAHGLTVSVDTTPLG